mmetsp:Transcript_21319/g.69010  ORF Transcript_21319/g.69010 Transcript_21319/m.69010 type:complete len:92 (+) Transcript_21319:143-418(+)
MAFLIPFLLSTTDKVDVLTFFKNHVGLFPVAALTERHAVTLGFTLNVHSTNTFNFNFKQFFNCSFDFGFVRVFSYFKYNCVVRFSSHCRLF